MRIALWLLGALLVGAVMCVARRRRWLARERHAIDQRIEANRPRPKPDFMKADDSLRVRTMARRDTADRLRSRAAHVESGASAAQILRAVK